MIDRVVKAAMPALMLRFQRQVREIGHRGATARDRVGEFE